VTLREKIERVVTGILIIGLSAFGVGAALWVFTLLQRQAMPLEIQLVVIGLILMLLAVFGAKLFTSD
jgi:hypothetical protein